MRTLSTTGAQNGRAEGAGGHGGSFYALSAWSSVPPCWLPSSSASCSGGGIKYSDEESLLPQSCSLLALCHDSARVGQLQGSRQGLGLPPSAVLQLTGLRAMRRCTFTRERLNCIEPVEAHSTQEQE